MLTSRIIIIVIIIIEMTMIMTMVMMMIMIMMIMMMSMIMVMMMLLIMVVWVVYQSGGVGYVELIFVWPSGRVHYVYADERKNYLATNHLRREDILVFDSGRRVGLGCYRGNIRIVFTSARLDEPCLGSVGYFTTCEICQLRTMSAN
jgi:hypothetical protein